MVFQPAWDFLLNFLIRGGANLTAYQMAKISQL